MQPCVSVNANFLQETSGPLYHFFVHYIPGRHLEAEDVLDLGQHVFVHLMGQVSNRQKQIFDISD